MEFSIHSASSNKELVLSHRKGDYFQAQLRGVVESRIRVYSYLKEDHLIAFFKGLAAKVRPWEGELSWESLEGELSISATCSTLGHVLFKVKLWGETGSPEAWRVDTGITYDFGQLMALARSVEKFLSDEHT
jgi:hypothetical protein